MKRKQIIIYCTIALVAVLAVALAIAFGGGGTATVKFVYPDGTVIAEVEVEKGATVEAPTVDKYNGEVFVSWDRSLENITENVTITATMAKVTGADWYSSLVYATSESIRGKQVRYSGDRGVTELVFPVTFDGESILALSKNCAGPAAATLEKVVVPYGILEISANAFSDCPKLKEIVMAESVVKIGDTAFANCPISAIKIPASVSELSGRLFGVRNVSVDVTVSARSAHYKVVNGNIVSRDGRTFVAYTAFSEKEPILNAPINTITEQAFYSQNITKITFPNTLRNIKEEAFFACKSLREADVSLTGLEIIGEKAFKNTAITQMVIPNTLRQIGDQAFLNSSLTRIVLPEMVLSSGTFVLGENIFNENDSISVYCKASRAQMPSNESWLCGNPVFYSYAGDASGTFFDVLYHLPDGNGGWTVHRIESYEFGKSASLLSVPSIDGFRFIAWSLDPDAFSDPRSLLQQVKSEVNIYALIEPLSNVFNFTDYTYNGVSGYSVSANVGAAELSEIEIPEYHNGKKIIAVASQGFRTHNLLTSVTLPDSILVIDSFAFSGCYNLSLINLPYGLAVIGNDAFNSCEDLTSVTLPASLTAIGDKAFYESGLTGIRLQNVRTIGISAFENCSAIKVLIIPSTVSEVKANAFKGIGVETTIVIPKTLLKIGANAFAVNMASFDCRAFTENEVQTKIANGDWSQSWAGNSTKITYKSTSSEM